MYFNKIKTSSDRNGPALLPDVTSGFYAVMLTCDTPRITCQHEGFLYAANIRLHSIRSFCILMAETAVFTTL